jgi:hypothetical protein
MTSRDGYVDWDTYAAHLQEAKGGFERLDKLDAEVLGDNKTGRPSLRMELSNKLDQSRNIQAAILVIILGRVVFDWFTR